MNHNSVIQTVVEVAPAFPPSFDNDPWLFGWALFSRLVILMLASATVIRLVSRNRCEGITAGHPVFYHRLVVICFCASTWLGSGSDAITYLMWGEISTASMGLLLIVTKIMDGLTMIPFIMALFVPFWMTWARWSGIVPAQKGMILTGTINDLRITWVNGAVPFKLVLLTAAVAGLVSVSKYAAWAAHVRV